MSFEFPSRIVIGFSAELTIPCRSQNCIPSITRFQTGPINASGENAWKG